MSKFIVVGSNNYPIDNFEIQKAADGTDIVYVQRTADSYSTKIFALSNSDAQDITVKDSNSISFSLENSNVINYQYITEGNNISKEYFQIKGTAEPAQND